MVRTVPLVEILLLTMFGSAPKRRCHKLYVSSATASLPGSPSSAKKPRPIMGFTPTMSRKLVVTWKPCTRSGESAPVRLVLHQR